MDIDEVATKALRRAPDFVWKCCGIALAVSGTFVGVAMALNLADFPTKEYFTIQAEAYRHEKLDKYNVALADKAEQLDSLEARITALEERVTKVEELAHEPKL